MDRRVSGLSWPDVHKYVEAYESAHARDGQASIDDHRPPQDHPRRLAILCELIRVELEYRWERGTPDPLEDYRRRFPEVFDDPDLVPALAFEEYRLRLQAGEAPTPSEYRQRFGVEGRDLPATPLAVFVPGDEARPVLEEESEPLREAAEVYRSSRRSSRDDLIETLAGAGVARPYADLFGDLHRADPRAADRLALGVASLPESGEEVFGFRLESELGRGAFGRVFLARQAALADRPVALKVAADIAGESRVLAQLQHTNVVPVYSVHRGRGLQAICMPYLGSTTLADVLSDLRRHATLPDSGAGLLSSLESRKRTRSGPDSGEPTDGGSVLRIDPAQDAPPGSSLPAPRLATPKAQLDRLRGLRYPSAVLWLGARLADGLAHAHERGILHRDLKPANVLFADDGEPMLLDFNLAADTKFRIHASAALVGGTLPYMAPEQLTAYRDLTLCDDPRSDLYALGVILFELLTGRHPFPIHRGSVGEILPRMIADRSGPPPRLRPINPAVSPAVEAIVRRCLEPEPARRHTDARQLQEDLQRQLDDLPLKHTPEPSLRERLGKWARRHPRLTSSSTIALAAALLFLLLLGFGVARQRRLERLEATDSLRQLDDELRQVNSLLVSRDALPEQLREGEDLCRQVAERYELLDASHPWTKRSLFTALNPDERNRLRADLGESLFLWARETGWKAGPTTDRAARAAAISEALRLNAASVSCFGAGAVPRAVALQRAELVRLEGNGAEARRLREQAQSIPLRSPRERLLLISDQLDRHRFGEALDHFQDLLRGDAQNFALWLLLGNAYAGLDQFDDALASYSVAIALQPNLRWSYFNRGLLALDHQDFRQAIDDFTRVLELRPGMTEALINRSIARLRLDDPKGAVSDLNQALNDPDAPTRALFIRAGPSPLGRPRSRPQRPRRRPPSPASRRGELAGPRRAAGRHRPSRRPGRLRGRPPTQSPVERDPAGHGRSALRTARPPGGSGPGPQHRDRAAPCLRPRPLARRPRRAARPPRPPRGCPSRRPSGPRREA